MDICRRERSAQPLLRPQNDAFATKTSSSLSPDSTSTDMLFGLASSGLFGVVPVLRVQGATAHAHAPGTSTHSACETLLVSTGLIIPVRGGVSSPATDGHVFPAAIARGDSSLPVRHTGLAPEASRHPSKSCCSSLLHQVLYMTVILGWL